MIASAASGLGVMGAVLAGAGALIWILLRGEAREAAEEEARRQAEHDPQ
jgi:hypothetical protein